MILPTEFGTQLDLVAENHIELCGAKAPIIPEDETTHFVDPPPDFNFGNIGTIGNIGKLGTITKTFTKSFQ